MVGVAQLVEHPVVVRDVAGSSPVAHPIFPKYNSRYGSKLQHRLEPLFEGELVEHGAVCLTYVGLDDSRLRRYGPFKLKMVK